MEAVEWGMNDGCMMMMMQCISLYDSCASPVQEQQRRMKERID